MKEKMIAFEKYHGTGNDFIIIDGREFPLKDPLSTAKELCKRHFSIGANDVLYLEESSIADIKIRILEPDGTEADMCGNGVRCVGAYLSKEGKEEATIETLSGIKKVSKKDNLFTVDMGEMQSIEKFITPKQNKIMVNMKINEKTFYIVSSGEPHAVAFTHNLKQLDIIKEALPIAHNFEVFPKGINIDFIERQGNDIKVRTFERGVWDETLACGTGAVASAFVAKYLFSIKNGIKVQMEGGELFVTFENKKSFLTGEAKFVYRGEIEGTK